MYELKIAPKITENVSSSARRFIESKGNVVRIQAEKDYEYLGADTIIPMFETAAKEYTYFSPSTIINPENQEVAKFISILG